jgi:zinc D-Ala-D-Ala dipeptidase
VVNAFRTLDTQIAGWETYRDHLRALHPDWPVSVLHRETNRFIHPPDHKCPPGHTTGGAVDVCLIDEAGEPLDDFAELLSAGRQVWRTFSRRIGGRSRATRQALYDTMVGVGFSNCYDEWWHYSWGDSGWAGRLGHPVALYSAVPEECFPPQLAEVVAGMRQSDTAARLREWLAASLAGEDTRGVRPAH